MDVVRKLAWAALLVGSGAPSMDPPAPALPASAPAQSPKPNPPAAKPQPVSVPETTQPGSTWPLDLDDDEFEGDGWSFWPVSPRRD